MASVYEKLHPEVRAGGFAHNDPRINFYLRVNALLNPEHEVLDFGAGRGMWGEVDRQSFIRQLTQLKGSCRRLVGFDVDEVVLENSFVDEAFHAAVGEPLPFEDGSFDLIVSWMVLEHISDPEFYAHELDRVLKPGGWICAGTPNRWGYFAIGARLIPDRFHDRILSVVSKSVEQDDVFPTVYKLNTIGAVATHFPGYRNCSYIVTGPPGYHGDRLWLARLWSAYNAITPRWLGPYLHIFLQKP